MLVDCWLFYSIGILSLQSLIVSLLDLPPMPISRPFYSLKPYSLHYTSLSILAALYWYHSIFLAQYR